MPREKCNIAVYPLGEHGEGGDNLNRRPEDFEGTGKK